MVISVDKIIVKDRIRKDFGDIAELAADIKENGLINPIVVNKDYALLAGERRLRAVKHLGWPQVEVRMMDTRDAEHELNIEISENDVRKAFSKSERVDYMYRLMRIERKKAEERQKAGTSVENNAEVGRSDENTAKAFGVSATTMRKEMQIVENKNLLDQKDFADWDEGKLSTNKAYQQMKAKMKQLEEENQKLHSDNKILSRRAEPTVIEKTVEVEVVPDDYEQAKRDAEIAKKDFKDMRKRYDEMAEKWKASEKEKRDIQQAWENEKSDPVKRTRESALLFCAGISNFMEKYGGYIWVTEKLDNLTPDEKKGFLSGINALEMWVRQMRMNIEGIYEEH